MLIYHSQGQDIEDGDIILISKNYFIVTYDMRICTFVLYPLGGHSLQTQHPGILNDVDWEWVGHLHDIEYHLESQMFLDRMPGGFSLYLETINTNLSI